MKNYVYIAQSIDGFIAKKDGDISFLEKVPNPHEDDFGFGEFIKKIDAILMGRKTFEKVLSFEVWPYEKPVYILSKTIKEIPKNLKDKVFIIKGSIIEVIESLESKGIENLYIDGGKVIQSFLKEDKVDFLTISILPIILGDGIALFDRVGIETEWEHLETKVYNDYLIKNCYKRCNKKN